MVIASPGDEPATITCTILRVQPPTLFEHTHLDAALLALSVVQAAATLFLAATWERSPPVARAGGFLLLVFMTVYNIIVVSHLFTHAQWFHPQLLNSLVSMLNSVNIGQSVQAYQLTHVRNHHKYNNDRRGPDGKTKDYSSTYRDGVDGEHASLKRYAFLGALSTLAGIGRDLLSVTRLWRVGPREEFLLSFLSNHPVRRANELRQVRLDRIAHFAGLCLFLAVSWKWTLSCYLPAFYLSLALINVQNYYEHYGASPDSRYTDSVSHYGRIYNLLSFNDGHHQEHHLRPQSHWSQMPLVRRQYGEELDRAGRAVSPVPAIVGFLHRDRRLLHRSPPGPAPAAGHAEDSQRAGGALEGVAGKGVAE